MNMKQFKTTYSNLPASVYVIFFTRFVNSMGNFVFPFMTLLLTAKMGMGEEKVGTYLLLAAVVQIPGSVIGGKLSDIIGRKKVTIVCMILAACCYLPCAFLLSTKGLMVFVPWLMILSSFFNSIVWPASGAMINDLTVPENRQTASSLLYMGMNAGTAVGSLIAGFLFNHYLPFLFIGDAITTLLSVALLAKYVPESKPTKEEHERISQERKHEKVETGNVFTALWKRPRLLIFILLNIVYNFVYAQTHFSFPLQTNLVFGEERGAIFYGTLCTINCLEVIFLTTFLTMLTKKWKAATNVALAGVFYAVGFGMLFFVKDYGMFVVSTIIWTVGEIISATNVGVYVANHTPVTHRGRFNAIHSVARGIGSSLSPYIMGAFIASQSVRNAWPIIFILSMASALAFYILGTLEKESEPASEHELLKEEAIHCESVDAV